MVDFNAYSQHAVHLFSTHVPPLLRRTVEQMPNGAVVADYGCGDGHLIWALRQAGLLERSGLTIGLDISGIRVGRFVANTGQQGVLHDISAGPPLADRSLDVVLSTMVIEHAPDDCWMVRQIARMLKPGGKVYLTTVVKRRWAWYFRRSPDGRWVLDSTHVREYGSPESVERLMKDAGLHIEEVVLTQLAFPIIHPVVRIMNRIAPIRGINKLFTSSRTMRVLELAALPIPGYRTIEIVAAKP